MLGTLFGAGLIAIAVAIASASVVILTRHENSETKKEYEAYKLTVEGKVAEASTTLADLFTQLLSADLSSAVRASLRSWLDDEIDDCLAYGRQARLRRRTVDSFFSAPLVRDGDAGGMRKRS